MSRLACLYVPLFPLAARLRSEPELRSEALVILEGNGPAARVAAANRVARRVGLRAGMSLPQARALMPKLVARGRDAACEDAAQQALLETAESFSPRVEDAGEGLAYLDLSGTERRFAGIDRERALGEALVRAAERAALPARCGIASAKLAARVAAALPATPTVVALGDEANFLAPLPLERLTPQMTLRETLQRWGIHTIGELAKLPRDEVASRLGPAGQKLHEIARGLDPQPLLAREPPPDFREGMDLEWPLVALEPFLFVARAALDRLLQRLEARGLGCATLDVALRLEPEGTSERSIALPAPTRDAKTLLTLVKLDLEAKPPGAPVMGFAFTARPDHPRQAQLSLLGPSDISPDRLATALAKLFALLGPDQSGSPRAADGHRPERIDLKSYAPPPAPLARPTARAGRGILTVRVLRPPLPVEVIVGAAAVDSAGSPSQVRTPAGEASAQRLQIDGAVRVASGPWHMEETWWNDPPTSREYWDIEMVQGGLYRLYRDRTTGDWYADGVYD